MFPEGLCKSLSVLHKGAPSHNYGHTKVRYYGTTGTAQSLCGVLTRAAGVELSAGCATVDK